MPFFRALFQIYIKQNIFSFILVNDQLITVFLQCLFEIKYLLWLYYGIESTNKLESNDYF